MVSLVVPVSRHVARIEVLSTSVRMTSSRRSRLDLFISSGILERLSVVKYLGAECGFRPQNTASGPPPTALYDGAFFNPAKRGLGCGAGVGGAGRRLKGETMS